MMVVPQGEDGLLGMELRRAEDQGQIGAARLQGSIQFLVDFRPGEGLLQSPSVVGVAVHQCGHLEDTLVLELPQRIAVQFLRDGPAAD
jgi:hypothetical protein